MENQGCKPLSRRIHAQNIEQEPVYRASFALYITLGCLAVSRASTTRILLCYIVAGPLIGAIVFALGYLCVLGAIANAGAVSHGLAIGIIYGLPLGIPPAAVAGLVHVVALRRGLRRAPLVALVVAGGSVTALLFSAWLTSPRWLVEHPWFSVGLVATALSVGSVLAVLLIRAYEPAT